MFNWLYLSDYEISIPYGAIKSIGDGAFKNSNFIFQFLMVRLKENVKKSFENQNIYFNSLWCD